MNGKLVLKTVGDNRLHERNVISCVRPKVKQIHKFELNQWIGWNRWQDRDEENKKSFNASLPDIMFVYVSTDKLHGCDTLEYSFQYTKWNLWSENQQILYETWLKFLFHNDTSTHFHFLVPGKWGCNASVHWLQSYQMLSRSACMGMLNSVLLYIISLVKLSDNNVMLLWLNVERWKQRFSIGQWFFYWAEKIFNLSRKISKW